ncbi:MAG: ComF family protein [Candidatus Zixiibacteriota bacterium]
MLYAFGDYRDPLKEIIIQFKFRGITAPAKTLAAAIDGKFGDRLQPFGDAQLVPIPLYPSREYARGYNQAYLFAEALSEQLRMPCLGDILYRVAHRRPQAKLHHDARTRNVKGVFEVAREAEGRQQVILVDDVVTTGATVAEARRVLLAAGYQVPAVIAMAHGL